MTEQFTQLLDVLRVSWEELAAFLPRLALSLVLLVVGWAISRLVRRLTIRVLRFLKADVAAERAGLEDFLVQGGVRFTTVTLAGSFVYWAVNLTVILAALTVLGIQTAGETFRRLVLHVPAIITAVVILILGTLLGQFVGAITHAYLANLGVTGARAISAIARWAIVVFVIAISLEQLSIGGQILVSAFQMAFGALCLALALAFGLGGRDWAARVLDNILKK
jgi:Mechanosensitive ion channel, conserved TM helix